MAIVPARSDGSSARPAALRAGVSSQTTAFLRSSCSAPRRSTIASWPLTTPCARAGAPQSSAAIAASAPAAPAARAPRRPGRARRSELDTEREVEVVQLRRLGRVARSRPAELEPEDERLRRTPEQMRRADDVAEPLGAVGVLRIVGAAPRARDEQRMRLHVDLRPAGDVA